MREYDYHFKLVIIGDRDVGKSSVLRCIEELVDGGHQNRHTSPIRRLRTSTRNPAEGDGILQAPNRGSDNLSRLVLARSISKAGFIKKDVQIDGKKVTMEIWNAGCKVVTDSQQDSDSSYKDANGVIVVYDVTNEESFEHVKQKWVKEITMHAPPTVAVMILGNKSDCSNRVVTTKTGQSYATKQGFQFKETSALKNENINQAIERMVKIMIGPVVKDKDFLKAVHKGKGEMTQLNVILHGPPGVGKTSLKRIILGLPPLPKHERHSTGILENTVRAVAIDGANSFKEISNEEFIELLADTLVEQIHQQAETHDKSTAQPVPSLESSGGGGWGFFKRKLSLRSQQGPEQSDFDSKLPGNEDDFEVEDISLTKARNIRLLRDEIVFANPSSSIFQSIWHHIIDSGGQPQFQDMLPCVYRSPSFQIVLMRLIERLDEKPKMQFTIEGENAIESPEDLPLTNLQYIERACQIAASCDSPSKVLIVGTHKDQLGPDGELVISQVNSGLAELYRQYKDVVICKSNHEIIFDINTMAVGEEREQYMTKLQEMISGVSSKWAKPENVKLKWLCFHLAIDKEETGVVKYADCLTVGNSLGMRTDSVTKALKYFSNTGLVLYYDEMPEIVLTKINPLVDRLSELIRASLLPPPLLKSKCDDFRQRGTFDKAFFDELFPDTVSKAPTQSANFLDNGHFLKFLLYLKLAVEVDRDEYFIPSALSFYSAQKSITVRFSESCGFALEHKENKRILPHGFFFTTAIELQSASSVFNFQFHGIGNTNRFKFELRKDDQQYRDRIQFHDKSESITDVVILTDNKWWIEVTVANNRVRPTPKTLQEVRKAVFKAMKRALNSLKQVCRYSITKVFPCPEEGHTDHYCTLMKNKSEYMCSVNITLTGPSDRFLCWSGKPYVDLSLPALEEPPVNVTRTSVPSPALIWPDAPPTHSNVFDLLKPVAVHWNDIARKFDIDFNQRKEIRDDIRINANEDRLEAAINLWIEQQKPPVTWDTLHKILTELKYGNVVRQLVSQYSENDNDDDLASVSDV